MNPVLRFYSIIVSLATLLIFLIWVGLNQVIMKHPWLAVILSGLISLGIYRTLAFTLLSLLKNVSIIKRFILGPQYLQGTWAGFFIGHNHKIRLFVEIFEQDLHHTVIRGRVYHEDGTFHGSWIAEDATIDPILGKLTYYYHADAIENTFINSGIASFDFMRASSSKPPMGLIGFSSDLFNPHKLLAFEDKISEEHLLSCDEGFKKAQEVYKKYKEHVTSMKV